MAKKLFCGALAALLLSSCLAVPAFAAETTTEEGLLISPNPNTQTDPAPTDTTAESLPTTEDADSTPAPEDADSTPVPEDADSTPVPLDPAPVTPTPELPVEVYSDLAGHWAAVSLQKAVSDGYMRGYGDGKLHPNDAITGAQVTTIVARYLDLALDGGKNTPISRADAFAMLDSYLLLSPGVTPAALSGFGDAYQLSASQRETFAALLSSKLIAGFEDHTLRAHNSLTRAEFITLLYKLSPPNTVDEVTIEQSTTGRLCYPTAVRSLTLADGVSVDTLVVRLGDAPKITLGRNSSIAHLILVGEGTALTIPTGVKALTLASDATKLDLTVNASLDALHVQGKDNSIAGKGSAKILTTHDASNQISLPADKTEAGNTPSLAGLSVSLNAPATLPIEGLLRVTATLPKTETAFDCLAVWLVNGQVVKQDTVTVSPDGGQASYVASFSYSRTMNTNFSLQFELRHTGADGTAQVLKAQSYTYLENYSNEYYDRYLPANVLKRVKTGYAGNFTRQWAENNDYDALTKEIWINTKGHASDTDYLIWINTHYQRVNVFQGSAGNWKLIKSFIVSTGRKGTDTPVGSYTISWRQPLGWTTKTYHVSPVVRFKWGSGLAFHSRQYDPTGTRIVDGSIGFPSSQGCIRMYDEDIHWIDDYMPQHTKVVVF